MARKDSMISLPGGAGLPISELRFEFARSAGPGGQNVNKVNTRATLLFDLAGSPSIGPAQKTAIQGALGGRINQAGVLRIVSSKHRTQAANRAAAIERLAELLTRALTPRTPRKETRVPVAARARRLEQKRRTGKQKRLRGRARADD